MKQVYFAVMHTGQECDMTVLQTAVDEAMAKLAALGPSGCKQANIQLQPDENTTIDVNISEVVTGE